MHSKVILIILIILNLNLFKFLIKENVYNVISELVEIFSKKDIEIVFTIIKSMEIS